MSENEAESDCENDVNDSSDTDIADDYSGWDVTHTAGTGEHSVYWNVTGECVANCNSEVTLSDNLEKDGAVTDQIMEIEYSLKDPSDNG